MKTLIDVATPVLTFILMVAVGLDLTAANFARVRRQPGIVLAGLAGPVLLLPPIALVVTLVLQPPPYVAAGLLLVAACPVGGIANAYCALARISPAMSVTLTGLSCLLAGATLPLLGRALQWAAPQPLDLRLPIPIVIGQLFLMLTLPVALGMWVRRRRPDLAGRYASALQRLTFIAVAFVLALIVLDDPQAFRDESSVTVPVAALFVVSASAVGWLIGRLVSSAQDDRFTLAVNFSTRNLGVAMAVAVTMLGRLEFARFACVYFLTELPLMIAAIVVFRRWREAHPLGALPAVHPDFGTLSAKKGSSGNPE